MACVRSVKRLVTLVWTRLQALPYLLRNPRVDGARHIMQCEVTYGGFVTGKNRVTVLSSVDSRSCRATTVINYGSFCVEA